MSAGDRFETAKPVAVIDRVQVLPGRQREVYRILTESYAAHVAPRGLRLVGAWLSPPFERPDAGSELLAVWEYESLGALWGARMAEEEDPVARAIWAELAPLTAGRSRQIGRAAPMDVPAPEGAAYQASAATRRIVLVVRPLRDVAAAAQAEWVAAAAGLPGATLSQAGFHDGISFMPGHLTWDIAGDAAFEDGALLAVLPGPAEIVQRVALAAPLDAGVRDVGLSGTKRTILLRLKADADAAARQSFEAAMAATPRYITGIANWRFSQVAASPAGWTHCFEQEVADAAIFLGDYLNHPYHWAVIERLFHPDAPERIADGFCHTLYPIERSVLARL